MDCSRIIVSILGELKLRIESDEFLQKYRVGNCFTRKRNIVFKSLIYYLLSNGNNSIENNISSFRTLFKSIDLPKVSKQALSKSRQGISSKAFSELFDLTVDKYYSNLFALKKFKGYNVLAVDGTTIQLPTTQENCEVFGYSPNQTDRTEAVTTGSMIYDVLNDYIVDAKINKYKYAERKSAIEHLDRVKELSFSKDTILVFDRGYPSYEMFSQINDFGYSFVIRTSKSYTQISNTNSLDSIIQYKSKNGQSIALRAIKVLLPNGEFEYLATNIFDESFYIQDFKELYFLRWGVESKFKELKSQFQLENFTASKPIAIKQDFFITLLYSNLVSLIKSKSDSIIIDKSSNKHRYQSNRGFIIKKLKLTLVSMIYFIRSSILLVKNTIIEASKNKSIIRPLRSFSRRKRNTKKKYYFNSKNCL